MSADIKVNTILNMAKTLSSIVFPLITFPYISRILQPENIGKINFGNTIVSYFALIASLGVSTYAVRECSKVRYDRKALGQTVSEIISINYWTTVIAYVLLLLLFFIYKDIKTYWMIVAIQSISIFCTTVGADWLNMAVEDFKYITYRTFFFQILSILLMFLFVKTPEDYIKYVVITVVSASGGSLLNVLHRRKYCDTGFIFHCKIKKHLPPILALFSMLVAQQIFTMCDATIIGIVLGDYYVGIYSTASKIFAIINQVIVSVTFVVMPQLSVAFAKNEIKEIRRILQYVLHFSTLLAFPCAMVMFVYAREIVLIVGGDSYLPATNIVRIFAFTLVFAVANNYVLNVNLLANGKDKIALVICGVAAIVNIVTNIFFIPMFGIEAAAITTILSHISIVILCIPHLNKESISWNMFSYMAKPFIAVSVLALAFLVFRCFIYNFYALFVISATIGCFVYFGVLYVLKDSIVCNMVSTIILKYR